MNISNELPKNVEVANIIKTLTCPVDFEPLAEAVTLVPCMHKINETVALNIFDIVENNKCLKSEKCPVCRTAVIVYYPDHTIRDLVKSIFTKPEEILKKCILEKKEIVEIPYPGIKAKFVYNSGDWNYRSYGYTLCKKIEFKSVTPHSLFKELRLEESYDGELRITVVFDCENGEKINSYLASKELPWNGNSSFFVFKEPYLKKIFIIIANNNEIPEEYLQKLMDIVEIGVWEMTEKDEELRDSLVLSNLLKFINYK